MFLALLENKLSFLPHFHQKKNHDFPIMQQWKEKKIYIYIYENVFFPTYLPNQNIQGRVLQTNNFLSIAWITKQNWWYPQFDVLFKRITKYSDSSTITVLINNK